MNKQSAAENVVSIFPINQNKTFSEEEAYRLLISLRIVTHKAKNKINSYSGQANYYKRNPKQAEIFQIKLNEEIQKWSEKTRRLGAVPLSLYKVKIFARQGGFFTWEYPSAEMVWKA